MKTFISGRSSRVLGVNLKKLKKKYGLTVRVMAKETGLTACAIYNHLNGRNLPNAVSLDIYAEYFKVSFSELFKGEENEKN